jgi:hypothetical protein
MRYTRRRRGLGDQARQRRNLKVELVTVVRKLSFLTFVLGVIGSMALYATNSELRAKLAKQASMALTRTRVKLFDRVDVETYLAGLRPGGGWPASTQRPATGPLQRHPENPRYFADADGRPVYLTGSHTWLNLVDGGSNDPSAPFDYELWLQFLEQQNHNFFRLWTWEQTKWAVEPDALYYGPSPYLRTGPGLALDGKPKFDLTKFDPAYFDRLRQRTAAAGARGIYVGIMLFNGWSVAYPKGKWKGANPWRGHPYNGNNNVNGIDGDPNGDDSGTEIQELIDPKVTALQEGYVRKVIDTVNDLDNVLYEISNESHAASILWQYHMIDFIKAYERRKPKQHPVGMTSIWPGGRNIDLYRSKADWISPNGPLDDPPAADGQKVILLDTDHLGGFCGDRHWAWKSFTQGHNPLFMDLYDDAYGDIGYDLSNDNDTSLRVNLGYTLAYANRLDLTSMMPRGDLSSSGYCLANPAASGAAYLVYLPSGGNAVVNLAATPGTMTVEWFDPTTGRIEAGGTIDGGAERSFAAPFDDDAVLYLHQE